MGVTITTGTTVTSITGYKCYGSLRLGSNGDPYGDWEYAIGGASGGPNTGRETWDPSPTTFITTPAAVNVTFTDPEGGANPASMDVAGGAPTPVTISGGTFTVISSVQVRAVVLESGNSFKWASVAVQFYKSGSVVETLNAASISADSTGSGSTIQSLAVFTPTNNNNDKVVITGGVTLFYNNTEIDSPDTVSGQIYVFGS